MTIESEYIGRRPARRRRGDPLPLASPRWRPARARPWSPPCRPYLNALAGQGRPRRHGQRLPGPARRRVDDADLPAARPDRRLHPDRPARPGPPRRLRLRHHLRHQQGVRLRLPPRRAEAAPARRRRHRKTFEQAFLGRGGARRGARCPSSAPTTTRSSTRPTAS